MSALCQKRTFSAFCIMSATLGHETVIHRRPLVPKELIKPSGRVSTRRARADGSCSATTL
jgi:hypothetical protein